MRKLEIGVVTDEISRDIRESLSLCRQWGIGMLELREGSTARFPNFTPEELRLVDEARASGSCITAVSPGILKTHADNRSVIRDELENVLPKSIDLALRLDCPLIIVFGCERYDGESDENRTLAMRAFEQAAERAAADGLTIAIENEPNFWVDRPADEAAMLAEIGHPNLKANWDPANSHWGGYLPDRAGFEALAPYIVNVHVKDFTPDDPDVPWRPVGKGSTPWTDYLPWVSDDTDVDHITIE
ncbi:MAG: sugar phosphate isomerase/epimerase family protein, partial [Rhodothermales bacterium]